MTKEKTKEEVTEDRGAHIFDDAFRTMEEHVPELMIPLINEVFDKNYPPDVKITRLGDRHHRFGLSRETDSAFGIEEKVYHLECESNPKSGKIAVRMFEYDMSVALDELHKENGRYVLQLPQMEQDEEKREQLVTEYQDIMDRLAKELGTADIDQYTEIYNMMKYVLEHILRKSRKVQKGVEQVMGGKVLESFKERTLREGQILVYVKLVRNGILDISVAAEQAGMSMEEFEKLVKEYVIPA